MQRPRVLTHGQHQGHSGSSSDLQKPAIAWLRPALRAIDKQILPIALVSFIVLGVIRPKEGLIAHELGLSNLITIAIFIISGLQLKRGDALAAAKATGDAPLRPTRPKQTFSSWEICNKAFYNIMLTAASDLRPHSHMNAHLLALAICTD